MLIAPQQQLSLSMNAVEIEEAVSELASVPCDLKEFPFAFLAAFGNKAVTIKKLRSTGKSSSNKSDVEGGVLQRLNIHIAVSDTGALEDTLRALRGSPQTAKAKAKYILATDGERIEAEELASGDVLSCAFEDLGNHFGFFLTLAGISAVREVKDNPIDIKATSRLNKLYVELLEHNPSWATAEGQVAFNQFLARLVFCYFAEDTGVFSGKDLFTNTVTQMTEADGSNTHEVLEELFRAMDSDPRNGGRKPAVKSWADKFPYVNGGLFAGTTGCPVFSRTARSYLLRAGELDWQAINPDIFGSMIQAVADDDERGSLGMHYTSVPNIEKVLNPLFLDDLREQLEAAGDNRRKLLNLRKRLPTIRVFDPACGSGNFLVIAYIRLREIEAELMQRRGEPMDKSIIQLTQFYGIEIKPFAVEIARLSLLIAEFQCNVKLIGQMQAQMLILPLHETGYIVAGNALRLDWGVVCPPGEEGEIYVCGNPPYLGDKFQSAKQKEELSSLVVGKKIRAIDYIVGWFWKASDYMKITGAATAFVTTNSTCQGVQVPLVWPRILSDGLEIFHAVRNFKWSNNATNNAGVIVSVVGIRSRSSAAKSIVESDVRRIAKNINPYLVDGPSVIVTGDSTSKFGLPLMNAGNIARDKGNLMLSAFEREELLNEFPEAEKIVKRLSGSKEAINGLIRYCLWIGDGSAKFAETIPFVARRLKAIREYRANGSERGKSGVDSPHRFERTIVGAKHQYIVPRVSSERREYLPIEFSGAEVIVSDAAMAVYDPPAWSLSIFASRIHLVWIATVCGKMKTDFRYSNTLGWNTFPVPTLTETNKADLSRCAEDILLAREAHFPATIADLYKPDAMPADLRAAHDLNDETLERIYIGRRFKNDTERLEKLFELYTEMTTKETSA